MLLASRIHGRARDSRQRTTDRGLYTYAQFRHVAVDASIMVDSALGVGFWNSHVAYLAKF